MPSLHTITLKDMRFHVLVGVLPHEQLHRQPLEVDVTVWLDPGPVATGDAALDYRDLQAAVAATVDASPIRYLEDFVRRAADAVLRLAPVTRVRIAARKPHVALPVPLAYAEVSLERGRDA